MKRVGRLVCGLTALFVVAGLVPDAFARALFAYPLQGQSQQQQDADRPLLCSAPAPRNSRTN
jgi:hypothetical protein